jgi:hypothetical protein
MYSVLFLGAVMICDGFGLRVPEWVSPAVTFLTVGASYLRSLQDIRRGQAAERGPP